MSDQGIHLLTLKHGEIEGLGLTVFLTKQEGPVREDETL